MPADLLRLGVVDACAYMSMSTINFTFETWVSISTKSTICLRISGLSRLLCPRPIGGGCQTGHVGDGFSLSITVPLMADSARWLNRSAGERQTDHDDEFYKQAGYGVQHGDRWSCWQPDRMTTLACSPWICSAALLLLGLLQRQFIAVKRPANDLAQPILFRGLFWASRKRGAQGENFRNPARARRFCPEGLRSTQNRSGKLSHMRLGMATPPVCEKFGQRCVGH